MLTRWLPARHASWLKWSFPWELLSYSRLCLLVNNALSSLQDFTLLVPQSLCDRVCLLLGCPLGQHLWGVPTAPSFWWPASTPRVGQWSLARQVWGGQASQTVGSPPAPLCSCSLALSGTELDRYLPYSPKGRTCDRLLFFWSSSPNLPGPLSLLSHRDGGIHSTLCSREAFLLCAPFIFHTLDFLTVLSTFYRHMVFGQKFYFSDLYMALELQGSILWPFLVPQLNCQHNRSLKKRSVHMKCSRASGD